MKYHITLGSKHKGHFESQSETGCILRKLGFIDVKWYMGTGRKNGDSLHTWQVVGDEELILVLKLSADIEKIVEVSTEIIS